MSAGARWIAAKAAASIYPEQVERTLSELAELWPAEDGTLERILEAFPLGSNAVLHLFAVSSICAARVVRDPKLLLWLADPAVSDSPRSYAAMVNDLRSFDSAPDPLRPFRTLRSWKAREMTRISLREVAGVAPLEEITAELSQLADICVSAVYHHWDSELRRKHGAPQSEFAVIGLGKLGGGELNHSSDIDVIFLYGEEGQVTPRLSNHEWFNRLAARIAETFSATDPAGSLFRIDLRLRPEGSAGPLARSLESMENYYAGFGETWERLALIKARGICGGRELTYDFLRQHQPFIYPKSPTPDLLDEIASIKRRIERDVVGSENLDRNVKLGVGGIREIEFVVQALQFIHGARHPFLQQPGTMPALAALLELDLLPLPRVRSLDRAYRFLRTVEHRLQIDAEQQTHTLPADPASLLRLALSLGFDSEATLKRALEEQMTEVREIFESVIESSHHQQQVAPNFDIFEDRDRAAKTLGQLEHGAATFHVAPRTRQLFRKLKPLLLQRLESTADPDATLNQFVRFVEAHGLRSLLFELLVGNPRLLDLLLRTFDASRFAGDLMIRRPQIVEDLTRAGTLDKTYGVQQHLKRLSASGATATSLDPVRTYRQTELLRILLRDVLGLVAVPALFQELTWLAEACLVHINTLINGDEELTIVAMGKFGGAEVGYGADLDVLFVGDNVRAAQNLIAVMAQPSGEGALPAVDARLRPDGDKGPLAAPLSSFAAYFESRAQPWELQALTRSRPLAGPQQISFADLARSTWAKAGARHQLFSDIVGMLQRVRSERSAGSDELNFKTGTGGLVEAEFVVQALQMRHGIWSPNFDLAVERLGKAKVFDAAEAATLRRAYTLLRNSESALRRWDNRSVSALPNEELAQNKHARLLGYDDLDAFAGPYRDARRAIHELFLRHLVEAAEAASAQ